MRVSLEELEERCRQAERTGNPGFTALLMRRVQRSGRTFLVGRKFPVEAIFSGGEGVPAVVYLRTSSVRSFLDSLSYVRCVSCNTSFKVHITKGSVLESCQCPYCGVVDSLTWE